MMNLPQAGFGRSLLSWVRSDSSQKYLQCTNVHTPYHVYITVCNACLVTLQPTFSSQPLESILLDLNRSKVDGESNHPVHIPVACTTQETVECPRNKSVPRTYGTAEAFCLVSTISLDLVATRFPCGRLGAQQVGYGISDPLSSCQISIRVEKETFHVLDNLDSCIRRRLNMKDFAAWLWQGTGSTSAPCAQEKGSGGCMLSGLGRKHLTCNMECDV